MTKESKDSGFMKPKKQVSNMVALKDFHIFLPPDTDIKIKMGDDLSHVPDKFHENLQTEGVLKGK